MADRKTSKDSASTRKAKAAAAKAAASARARTLKETGPGKHLGGFMDFVREQGVVGLAVGLALGTQVKTLVDQIVASFINPLLALLLPGESTMADKKFSLSLGDKTADFSYGAFVSVLISFLVVAAVIYFAVKALRLDKLDKKKS